MSSASILRRSTNQPAIPNRRAGAKQEDILLMQDTTIWRRQKETQEQCHESQFATHRIHIRRETDRKHNPEEEEYEFRGQQNEFLQ
jgi:hypothetical protein